MDLRIPRSLRSWVGFDIRGDLAPRSAPRESSGTRVCPHCWMVNPGPFHLCGRCGADMTTCLQESGGLRRTAPVQSPVPVAGGPNLSPLQRLLVLACVLLLALSYILTAAVPVQVRPAQKAAPRETGL